MPTCHVCNKGFKSPEALTQHLRDKKDERHAAYVKSKPNVSSVQEDIDTKSEPANKQNSDWAKEFIEDSLKNFDKEIDKELGLPESYPRDMKSKLSKRRLELSKAYFKESGRLLKEKKMELEQKMETRIKESWDYINEGVVERREKGIPNYVEKIPMKTKENIYYPKGRKEEPLKKKAKNELLDMATG